jgi:hypothetical protein
LIFFAKFVNHRPNKESYTIGNQTFFDGQNNFRRFIFDRRKLQQKLPKIDGPSKITIIFGGFASWATKNGWAAENRSIFFGNFVSLTAEN